MPDEIKSFGGLEAEGAIVPENLEEYYRVWPIVRCNHCGVTFGAFPDMVGRACPYCAGRDKQGRPVQVMGLWEALSVEQAEKHLHQPRQPLSIGA